VYIIDIYKCLTTLNTLPAIVDVFSYRNGYTLLGAYNEKHKMYYSFNRLIKKLSKKGNTELLNVFLKEVNVILNTVFRIC